MKDLNHTLIFKDTVVHENRAVDKSTNSRPVVDDIPHAGKPAEQIDMVQQRLAETGSGTVIILGDMTDDLGQIV